MWAFSKLDTYWRGRQGKITPNVSELYVYRDIDHGWGTVS